MNKFEALKLHHENNDKKDNLNYPFVATARVKAEHESSFFGCAFNPNIDWPSDQILVAVGGKFVHVYKFPVACNQIIEAWVAELSTLTVCKKKIVSEQDENLYTVTWCLDKDDKEGSHKIVTGGSSGWIYVIDAGKTTLENKLCGHGGSINDLRACPANPKLFLSASGDNTVRIFHILNDACLVIVGGPTAHLDQVLSADWSPDSKYIISCGFDHKVMKWDVSTSEVTIHLKTADEMLKQNGSNSLNRENETPVLIDYKVLNPRVHDKGFLKTIKEPTAVCSDFHYDTVDCVRCVNIGGTDCILSKGCGYEKMVTLWTFGLLENQTENLVEDGPQTSTTLRMRKTVKSGESWFMKFAVDPRNRWLACGGASGCVSFYDLTDFVDEPVHHVNVCQGSVRQLDFCDRGQILAVVAENGVVVRFDRVPSYVSNHLVTKPMWN